MVIDAEDYTSICERKLIFLFYLESIDHMMEFYLFFLHGVRDMFFYIH